MTESPSHAPEKEVESGDPGPAYVDSSEASKIYFLPNLMTAGNLSFMSIRKERPSWTGIL